MTKTNPLNDYIANSVAVQKEFDNDRKAYEAEMIEIQSRLEKAKRELAAKTLERDTKLAKHSASLYEMRRNIAPQIDFYNRVVELTLEKFRTERVAVYKAREELIISRDALIVKTVENKVDGFYYVFQEPMSTKKKVLSAKLFCFDPVAIAQRTRKMIRFYQREAVRAELKLAKTQLYCEEHNIGVAQKRYDTAANKTQNYQNRLNNLNKKMKK